MVARRFEAGKEVAKLTLLNEAKRDEEGRVATSADRAFSNGLDDAIHEAAILDACLAASSPLRAPVLPLEMHSPTRPLREQRSTRSVRRG